VSDTSPDRVHWENVYQQKDPRSVSWYRAHLEVSMALLRKTGLGRESRVIDVGGGASSLVDDLIAFGASEISVLDLSAQALRVARLRLGEAGKHVQWRVESVLDAQFEEAQFDFWHDRAVLHFLTQPVDVKQYAEQVASAIGPGGHAVIGGFAPDGPERCSDLLVARRAPDEIARLLGPAFRLVDQQGEQHRTPAGVLQSLCYAVLQRV